MKTVPCPRVKCRRDARSRTGWARVGIAGLFLGLAARGAAGDPVVPSNLVISNPPALETADRAAPAGDDPVLGEVRFNQVPLLAVVKELARQAGLNLLIDPEALSRLNEPITLDLRQVSGRWLLHALVASRGLELLDDPRTRIHRIRIIRERPAGGAASPGPTPAPPVTLEAPDRPVVPLVQFQDAPLRDTMVALAREAGVPLLFDPKGAPPPDTPVSLRLENVRAVDVLQLLAENHRQVLSQLPGCRTVWVSRHRLAVPAGPRLPRSEPVPVIAFENVPLIDVLRRCAADRHVNLLLDPTLDPQVLRTPLSFRVENLPGEEVIETLAIGFGWRFETRPGLPVYRVTK